MLLEQTHSHAKWSAALLVSKPFYTLTRCSHFSTCGIPFCSLLLTQTITNVLDARYYNPDPSSYSNRLTLTQNAPQFYSSDPSNPHHTLALILSWVLYKATWPSRWRSGKITTTNQILFKNPFWISFISSKQLSTALHRSTYVSQLHCQWIHLDLPTCSSTPPHVLLPPSFLPPPLINAAPSLTIIGAASFLHSITAQQREKPPHATSTVVMERFWLQKWWLINQKTNLKTCRVHTSEVTCY
jgi:hypothetical protein